MPIIKTRSRLQKKIPLFNLSLAETLLSIIIAIIGFGQLTIWLYSSSQIARDQSHIEFVNLLVEQAFADRGNPNRQNPLCIYSNDSDNTLVYVICEPQKPVAKEEYASDSVDPNSKRLLVRRFYDEGGKGVMAIDRYEYSGDNEVTKISRVIFQEYLWVVKCAYIETNYGPDGILSQSRFHGSCGADMVEIPTYPPMRFSSPPPIILFMPYR